MKRNFVKLLFVFVLTLTLVACNLNNDKASAETFVTIDINPSIGFVVDADNKITSINALNEDGEVLLMDLDVLNKTVDEVMPIILEKAIELGYIELESIETLVQVDVLNAEETIAEEVKTKVKDKVKKVLDEREIPNRVKDKEYNSELREQAQAYNIRPQHLRLIEAAMLENPELTFEDAVNLKVEELMIYVKGMKDKAGISQAVKHEFFTAKEEIRVKYQPLFADLKAQIKLAEDNGEDITGLEAEIAALHEEMQEEMQTVAASFKEQSKAIKETLKDKHKELIDNHKQKVEEHKEKIKDKINENKGKHQGGKGWNK